MTHTKTVRRFQLWAALVATVIVILAPLHANAWCVKNISNAEDGVIVNLTQPADGGVQVVLKAGESKCDPKASTAPDYPEAKAKSTIVVETAAGKLGCATAKAGTTCIRTCSNANAYPNEKVDRGTFILLGRDNANIDVYQRDFPDVNVKAGDVFVDLGTGSTQNNSPRRFVCR